MNERPDTLQLIARGADGQERTFFCRFEVEELCPSRLHVRVFQEPTCDGDRWFDTTILEVSPKVGRVVMMAHHDQEEYVARGIPEALIRMLASQRYERIVSSANTTAATARGEYRTPAATKVWQRLVAAGEATYDASADEFRFPTESRTPAEGDAPKTD